MYFIHIQTLILEVTYIFFGILHIGSSYSDLRPGVMCCSYNSGGRVLSELQLSDCEAVDKPFCLVSLS